MPHETPLTPDRDALARHALGRLAQSWTMELSPPVRRAMRAAKALYPSRHPGSLDPTPTPESLAYLAKAAGAPPAPLWARYGWFKSAVPGQRRGVWFHASDTGLAVPPSDRDSRIAFRIYCLSAPPVRLQFEPPLDPSPAPLGR